VACGLLARATSRASACVQRLNWGDCRTT
jgi:hypothetical protein